jgi:hypothetical protein
MSTSKLFNVYLTDTYAGELNYSWVSKVKIKANTEQGAVSKAARYFGLNFRKNYDDVYLSKSKATALVIDQFDDEYPSYDYTDADII